MRNSQILKSVLIISCAFLYLIDLRFFVSAQSPDDEKSKIKDFGSSLKRNANNKDAKDDKNGNSDEEVLRVETTLVVNDIIVFDKRGRSVQGLNKEDFIVTEDNENQEIQVFSLGNRLPIPRSIVLIIDYSPSLRPYINTSVEAAKTLVDKLNPKDRMAIVTDEVSLLADFTSDKTLLKKRLDVLKARALLDFPSRNLQYSALLATLNEMFDKKDIYPIIIFSNRR